MENDKSENQPIISSNNDNSKLNIENNLNVDSISLNDKKQHHHRKKKKKGKKERKKLKELLGEENINDENKINHENEEITLEELQKTRKCYLVKIEDDKKIPLTNEEIKILNQEFFHINKKLDFGDLCEKYEIPKKEEEKKTVIFKTEKNSKNYIYF